MSHFQLRIGAPSVLAAIALVTFSLLAAPPIEADANAGSTAAAPGATAAPADAAPAPAGSGAAASASSSDNNTALPEVVVTARRLNAERNEIETQTGASTYTIDSEAISATPGGENVQLNQVLLQAPDVVQDSFGQLHVRADHNDLQYRLNGVILPEGISVFSQTLSPRLISSLSLITGALPAEYGLRTAGIIDLTTNSGLLQPGGYISMYGGSHNTFQPAAEYGGSSGSFSYYVTGDYKEDDLGIESPDASANPLHDHTTQGHAFAYLEDILDSSNRLSLILGSSDDEFQIPNQHGLQPTLGLDVNGVSDFLSNDLNESQHELAQYAILSWQHSQGDFNWQSSLSARYTSLHFAPDWVGDLLYNGIAQNAFKDDTAIGWQTDSSYKVNAAHTVRAGFYLQHDSSESFTTSQVLPINAAGMQTSNVPLTIADNGTQAQEIESAYLQDEWQVWEPLTLNYGLRFDHYSAYSSGSQLSPRINFVWNLGSGTTVHGGYSRYFTPPPFELIGAETFTKFAGTTALPPGSVTLDTAPIAERANYYDFGVQQKLLNNALDPRGRQLLRAVAAPDRRGTVRRTDHPHAVQLPLRTHRRPGAHRQLHRAELLRLREHLLPGRARQGRRVLAVQLHAAAARLHPGQLHPPGSRGAGGGLRRRSPTCGSARVSAPIMLFDTGLRDDRVLADGFVIPNGDHTPSYTQVNLGVSHDFVLPRTGPLTVRFDVINVLDEVYQIRSGTGVGVFAPQYGPRRGLFGGVSWAF